MIEFSLVGPNGKQDMEQFPGKESLGHTLGGQQSTEKMRAETNVTQTV